MGIRPGRCYRNNGHRQRAYTRIAIKRPKKNYIGAAPALKIRQFNMGNPTLKYDRIADLVVRDKIDLRDNAIESVRTTSSRKLTKDLGKDFFFMKIRVYPSHLMRENKQAQGAGADRVSQGMTRSFGIPIGRAARVNPGQVIISVLYMKSKENDDKVKKALMRAKAKFPCDVEVKMHSNVKSVGTLPSKKIEEIIAVKTEEKKEGTTTEATATEETEGEEETKAPTTGTKVPAGGAKPDAGKAPAKPAGKK